MNTCLSPYFAAVLVAGLMLQLRVACCFPDLVDFDAPGNCLRAPTTEEVARAHGQIIQDATTTSFTAYAEDGKTLLSDRVCPGATHSITVAYTKPDGSPDKRRGLLTSSQGQLRGPGFASNADNVTGYYVADGCDGRLFLSPGRTATNAIRNSSLISATYTATLKVPCNATGALLVASYSARRPCFSDCGGDSNILAAVWTAAVDPSCAAAICQPPASPAQPATGSPAAVPAATSPAVADAAKSKSSGTPTCASSPLGYACSSTLGKVTVHWTIGGAAPPDNVCTGQGASGRPLLPGGDASQLVHFAVEGTTAGYVALGFAQSPSKMYDADVVLGWATPGGSSSNGHIGTYRVTGHSISEGDLVQPSWLVGGAAVQVSDAAGDARTTICFSRRASEPRALASQQLDVLKGQWALIWAVHGSDALEVHEAGEYGGSYFDAVSGSSQAVAAKDRRGSNRAHGILMAVAWALLLPLGTLLPAHRWVLGGWLWRGKAMWFWLHLFFQLMAMACFLAGLVIAFVQFPDPSGKLPKSHAYIGYTIIGMAGLQMIFGFVRPDPEHALRAIWNLLHINWGRITVLLSWANIFIGIVAFHQGVYGEQIAPWVAPIAACMAFLLGVDLALRMVRPTAGDSKAAFIAMGSLARGKPAGAGNPANALSASPTMGSSSLRFGSVTTVKPDGAIYIAADSSGALKA